jgi:hypothetical protein
MTQQTGVIDSPRKTVAIRLGLQLPLEERQARWDRIQQWRRKHSLAEMVRLEKDVSGLELTRERIRTIANGSRPGSVGRPRMPGLLARERTLAKREERWSARETPYSQLRLTEVKRELRSVRAAIKAEERRNPA